MRCAECGGNRDPDERGWVTVLSPSGTVRIHYCPDCMAELIGIEGADATAETADDA